MCGRFTQHHSEAEIIERFAVGDVLFELTPRYNIAPTQITAAIIASENTRQLVGFRWGLVPRWAKDTKLAGKMINARAESVADKPSFQTPLKRQRCLIPADGWYEWKQTPDGKQPHYFRRRDRGLFALAGLWEEWRDKSVAAAEPLRTCTIITCAANSLAAPIHERMPAILKPSDEAAWLDPELTSPLQLVELLQPASADEFEVFPVSRAVNSPATDGPDLIIEK